MENKKHYTIWILPKQDSKTSVISECFLEAYPIDDNPFRSRFIRLSEIDSFLKNIVKISKEQSRIYKQDLSQNQVVELKNQDRPFTIEQLESMGLTRITTLR